MKIISKFLYGFFLIYVLFSLTACVQVYEDENEPEQADDSSRIAESTTKEEDRDIMVEQSEEALVSDGTYTVTIGDLYEDFSLNEEEISWTESGVTVDNYQGSSEIDGMIHHIYAHEYENIIVYTSTYNLQKIDNKGDHLYIVDIQLLTPRFSTLKGIRVGATADEVVEAYGSEYIYRDYTMEGSEETKYLLCYEMDNIYMNFYVKNEKVDEIFMGFLIKDEDARADTDKTDSEMKLLTEAGEAPVLPGHENGEGYTDEELLLLSEAYYYVAGGKYARNIQIESVLDDGRLLIHFYNIDNRLEYYDYSKSVTLEWYKIDRKTGKGECFNGDSIDLTQVTKTKIWNEVYAEKWDRLQKTEASY